MKAGGNGTVEASANRCVCLLPLRFAASAIGAVLRAGGSPLIDAVGIGLSDAQRPREHAALRRALAARRYGAQGQVAAGLRLNASELPLADLLAGAPHHVVLRDWTPEALPGLLSTWRRDGRAIWLEIRERARLAEVDPALPFAGWLGRGAEAAGDPGRESAFILAQHLARQPKPFWLQGGIGVNTAAAAIVCGAERIVLDDALLLLRELALPAAWRKTIAARADDRRIDSSDPAVAELAPGQGAGQAAALAARWHSIGALITAVGDACSERPVLAAAQRALAPGAPLAVAHGTEFPVVQGPMTRVSDVPEFAQEVARAGALPMLALATMRGPRARESMIAAKQALGGRPWGAGLLGYLPPELAAEQFEVLAEVRPPFAVIAGGRPDQAQRLATLGIAAYIHVPTPALLRLFVEQGQRRFIFEGGECGGHAGPLYSFALWDAMVDTLLEVLPAGESVDVLFAGGIHDARSAAAVAVIAAPLVARGGRIGVLMGSAYLFTTEAVATGAIVPSFQDEAKRCETTALIHTLPGHRIRCAPTPFVDVVAARREELLRAGASAGAAGAEIEHMLVGRLRLASKGLLRTETGLVAAKSGQMRAGGVFMMGDVAGLRCDALTCAELHREVSEGGMARLHELDDRAAGSGGPGAAEPPPAEPVAIIGIGCLLPGAQGPQVLWRNLLDCVGAIGEVPRDRWDWRLYYDPDPAARDRIVSRWGGFIDVLPFDPLRFGIPPKSLASICIAQLLALEATRRALADAGLGDLSGAPMLRERTSAVFGAASTGDLELMYKARSALPLAVAAPESAYARLPEWTEESYPGILVNVIAGRVANRFDLGGCNFTVDAACASSLAALDIAVRELQSGRSDLALAGAVEAELSPHAFMAFSKTQALSPRGRASVFDTKADGIVISEGAVVLVLKRLADAERDGDRIYATLRSLAGSSDGKGMGLTAPKPAGQIRALRRAHAAARTRIAGLGLYEAHGTGTRVGDQAEIETLTRALAADGAPPGQCVVGSAKSLLGHTRGAAGLVGVAKAALALHHRVLPPHAGVTEPLPALRAPDAPVRLLAAPQPWLASSDVPRRAGVSAFGFGGTNFHAVLEEHGEAGVPGARIRPAELVVVAAPDRAGLAAALDRLRRAAIDSDAGHVNVPGDAVAHDKAPSADGAGSAGHDDAGGLALAGIAAAAWAAATGGGPERLALVASSVTELATLAESCHAWIEGAGPLPPQASAGCGPASGELAFLFPGQGAQYPGMGAELAMYQPEVAAALAASGLGRLILPPAAFDDASRGEQQRALADTRVAQPAIGALSCGLLDAMLGFGLAPQRVAGHSFGEFVALHAAGVLTREELLALARERGRVMSDVGPESGAMAMIALPPEAVAEALAADADVVVANRNAPRQTVISGSTAAVRAVAARLGAAGHTVRQLNVSAAFHSPLMAPARAPFAAFLADRVAFRAPALPVHGNRDGRPYPTAPAAIRARCAEHLEQPVDFRAQVEAMWDAGVRCFVELGPGRVLTGLVGQILSEREHEAIATDGGWRGLITALARLWALGWPVDLTSLFAGRVDVAMDLEHRAAAPLPAWRLDGGRVWRHGETPLIGSVALRDADTPADVTGDAALAGDPVAAAYVEYQRTMRQFLDQQEAMLARLLEDRAPGDPRAEVSDDVRIGDHRVVTEKGTQDVGLEMLSRPTGEATTGLSAPLAVEVAMLDRDALVERLVGLVAERTGYPPDMLRPDQDLEGELGVDSIKRIEIVGRMLKTLPSAIAAGVQQQFDRLVGARSVGALVDALLRELAAAPPATFTVGGGGGAGSSQRESETCPRFVMAPSLRPLSLANRARASGLVLVTEDQRGVAAEVLRRLRDEGANAFPVARDVLVDLDRLSTRVAVLREICGPVRGILHVAALDSAGEPVSLDAWRKATAIGSKGLFMLLQQCEGELADAAHPLRIVAATAMGGDWGRGTPACAAPGLGAAAAAGAHGVLASAEREYPHMFAKVVDLEPDVAPVEAAKWLVDELMAAGGGNEIGYQGGRRHVWSVEPAPWPENVAETDWRPGAGSVVLATGGARGITAGIVREIAAPGVRLVLVGRSTDPGADAAARDEREATLRDLRAAGAEVDYHALDVTDEAAFGGLIDDLYRCYGRIDAVLHGAGRIEDQALLAKLPESFDRVFDTKADSAFILARHLRDEGLRWVVLFGSIAGRFGNRGQADYAAGNETMLRVGQLMRRSWPATRVVTINWGPWLGSGMASDGVVALLEAQGILPIEAADGRRFVAEELARGREDEAEVIAGRGPWEARPDHLLASIFAASLQLFEAGGATGEHRTP